MVGRPPCGEASADFGTRPILVSSGKHGFYPFLGSTGYCPAAYGSQPMRGAGGKAAGNLPDQEHSREKGSVGRESPCRPFSDVPLVGLVGRFGWGTAVLLLSLPKAAAVTTSPDVPRGHVGLEACRALGPPALDVTVSQGSVSPPGDKLCESRDRMEHRDRGDRWRGWV